MKTLIPLTVASIAIATSITVFAGDALLSPRAADTQIKTVATVDKSATTVQHATVAGSPRLLDTRLQTVPGNASDPDTRAAVCALGTPRQLEQAGKFTAGSCCKMSSMACTRPKACCSDAGK